MGRQPVKRKQKAAGREAQAQGKGQFWDEAEGQQGQVDAAHPRGGQAADESPLQSGSPKIGGRQPSTAPGTALDSAGADDLGFDSPPVVSSDISNTEVAGYNHMKPYYPPGGGGDDLEDSKSADTPQRDKNDKPAL